MTLDDLRGRHKGEGCVLLGNGPSLDKYDLDRLIYPTIGMNRSWRKMSSPYHCVSHSRRYITEIENKLWQPQTLFVIIGLGDSIAHRRREWLSLKLGTGKLFLINRSVPHGNDNGCDLVKGIRPGFTGTFAIMAAVFLGFTGIYLLGYDGNVNQGHFKFNSDGSTYKTRDPDGSHRRGQIEQYITLQNMLDKKYPQVRIMNLNPDSAIDCWPKVPFQEVT